MLLGNILSVPVPVMSIEMLPMLNGYPIRVGDDRIRFNHSVKVENITDKVDDDTQWLYVTVKNIEYETNGSIYRVSDEKGMPIVFVHESAIARYCNINERRAMSSTVGAT